MPNTPGAVKKIHIGGRPRRIGFGFEEFATIEDALGPAWMFGMKNPTHKFSLVVLTAGLGRYDETVTRRDVAKWLDELETLEEFKSMISDVMIRVACDLTKKDAATLEKLNSGGSEDDDERPLVETTPPPQPDGIGTTS